MLMILKKINKFIFRAEIHQSGVFPALLTPFDSNDKINEKALADLIELNIKKNVTGFYVCGSTAEVFMLSPDERKYLMKLVKEIAGDRCTLICHVGAISTKDAKEYAKLSQKLGYDAVSAVAPFYYKFSFDEIKRYYYDIVSDTELPMIIYNFPNFSGVNLTSDNIGEFLNDERFIGLKHTSNDYFALERIKNKFPDKVVYNGFDEMFLAGIFMGADGGIGSTYNFMAEKFIKIRKLAGEGKLAEAQKIQNEANAVIEALVKVGVMQGEKAVLTALGMDFGYARAPFARPSDEKVKQALDVIMPLIDLNSGGCHEKNFCVFADIFDTCGNLYGGRTGNGIYSFNRSICPSARQDRGCFCRKEHEFLGVGNFFLLYRNEGGNTCFAGHPQHLIGI